jgi:hypothetical protein
MQHFVSHHMIDWICAALAATQQPFGVTDQQRDDAYSQWIQCELL